MADTFSEQDIFDSAAEPTPAQVEPPAQPEQPTAETTQEQVAQRQRDEQGRFAPKALEPAESQATTTEQQTAQVSTEPQRVPLPELIEERKQRQALERKLAELEGYQKAQEAFLRQQRQPQQPQTPQEPPDLLENPRGFVQHELAPVQQALQAQREEFSKLMATEKYGEEAVQTAFGELQRRVNQDPNGTQLDYLRIMRSPHPYAEMVKWHQQLNVVQTVGTDPNKWFESQLEQRLADPVFAQSLQAKLVPTLTTTQVGGRAAPIVALPSINRAPGTSTTPQDNAPRSEEDIWNAAPTRMGRRG